jgi:hypothetical protein
MIFETDTDMVAIWNGSAWRYIAATTPTNGTVLQVVTANYAVEDAKTNSTYGDTGLTATITPKSTSNKILVLVSQNGLFKTGNTAVNCKLLRGATDLSVFAYGAGLTSTAADNGAGTASCIYLDNPATTFATTYKTQFMSLGNVPSALVQYGSAMSTITLMELAG